MHDVFFWNSWVIFLKGEMFLKVFKILLSLSFKENRIIVYISSKITFGAFWISDTFCVFVCTLFFCCVSGLFGLFVFFSLFVLYLSDFSHTFLHFFAGWKASTACQYHQPVSQMLTSDSVFQGSFSVLHGTRTAQSMRQLWSWRTRLFACQIENWEHPTPAETKTDWKIFYSCPLVLSFCLFSTIALAMFFLIVFLDQQTKLNIDQWTCFSLFCLLMLVEPELQCSRELFYHLIHVVWFNEL